MAVQTSMHLVTLPTTVCLLSNQGVGTVVMKTFGEIPIKEKMKESERKKSYCTEKDKCQSQQSTSTRLSVLTLTPIGARSSIGHRDGEWTIVSKLSNKFIFKFTSPDRFAAGTVTLVGQ